MTVSAPFALSPRCDHRQHLCSGAAESPTRGAAAQCEFCGRSAHSGRSLASVWGFSRDREMIFHWRFWGGQKSSFVDTHGAWGHHPALPSQHSLTAGAPGPTTMQEGTTTPTPSPAAALSLPHPHPQPGAMGVGSKGQCSCTAMPVQLCPVPRCTMLCYGTQCAAVLISAMIHCNVGQVTLLC